MKTIRILFLILSLLVPQIALAEVYRWVDEKGVVHFTDDTLQIPEKYRPETEKIGIIERETKPKPQGETTPSKVKESSPKDRLGRDERYWKERVESWRKKLTSAEERAESLRMKYNDLTEKLNATKSSVERGTLRVERDQIKEELDQSRQQVQEAKAMLEKKIPEEAQLYGARPEWLKP
jgi:predicted  nucleic acid-binding Zn-ribbon protein